MKKPSDYQHLPELERELDRALENLRALMKTPSNTLAITSVEYRIGALRRRRNVLQGLSAVG